MPFSAEPNFAVRFAFCCLFLPQPCSVSCPPSCLPLFRLRFMNCPTHLWRQGWGLLSPRLRCSPSALSLNCIHRRVPRRNACRLRQRDRLQACSSALAAPDLGKYIGHTSAAFQDFCSFNLSLGLMNLLPFLPLDGGRLALALIEKRIGRARAQRTLSLFGIIFGVLLFCAGVLLVSATDAAFNPTPLAAGFFIFISALSEFRCSCGSNIKASLAGLSRLRSGSAGSRCADSTAKRLHGAKSTFVYRGQGIRHHFCC